MASERLILPVQRAGCWVGRGTPDGLQEECVYLMDGTTFSRFTHPSMVTQKETEEGIKEEQVFIDRVIMPEGIMPFAEAEVSDPFSRRVLCTIIAQHQQETGSTAIDDETLQGMMQHNI